jgi:hypothetical protein
MADIKKFLDQQGTTYLWSKIKAQLDTKADASRVTTLEGKVATLEANGYDDTDVKASIATNASDIDALETRMGTAETDIDAVESKVTTLIGDDTNKSVRTIANQELAAQLIPANAAEALDTLQEIAAWIQEHPGDAATMNSAISALQTKLTLGLDSNSQEYATVKAYVEAYVAAAIAGADLSQYALASDLTALGALVGSTSVSDQIDAKITALDLANTYDAKGAAGTAEQNAKDYAAGLATNYATAAQGALADTALQPADVVGLTNAEIDTAIAAANQSSGD